MKQNLNKQLSAQTKEWLYQRLSEFALNDDNNTDRLMLFLAALKDRETEIIAEFKSKIDKSIRKIDDHGHADWKNHLPLTGLNNIADALADVAVKEKYAPVLEIAEYALLKLDSISELQDECELDYLIDAFRDLHLTACNKLKPDQKRFGTHLASLANQSSWGYFDGPPDGYAAVLGKSGLSAYANALKNKN